MRNMFPKVVDFGELLGLIPSKPCTVNARRYPRRFLFDDKMTQMTQRPTGPRSFM